MRTGTGVVPGVPPRAVGDTVENVPPEATTRAGLVLAGAFAGFCEDPRGRWPAAKCVSLAADGDPPPPLAIATTITAAHTARTRTATVRRRRSTRR
jgi:hypothetical protein